jgi:hypothetical protein
VEVAAVEVVELPALAPMAAMPTSVALVVELVGESV